MPESSLPNFFILGAAKCGTTSLYHDLKNHPEIYLSKEKETHFFSIDAYYSQGIKIYIKNHFNEANAYKIRGEATPFYFHRPQKIIPRLLEHFDPQKIRFALIFRNPVERAWSHYLHVKRLLIETESFARALELEQKRFRNNSDKWFTYFNDGLYYEQLTEWLKYFPRHNFQIIISEHYRGAKQSTLDELFRFLGVSKIEVDEKASFINKASSPKFPLLMRFVTGENAFKVFIKRFFAQNTARRLRRKLVKMNLNDEFERPVLDNEIRHRLYANYTDDIMKLEGLLNIDLKLWKP